MNGSNVRTSWSQNHRLKEGLRFRSPANIKQVFKLLLLFHATLM